MPRRVFVRSPLEREPRYLDLESRVLLRALARFIAPARDQAADAPVQFTEMLPEPDQCWLQGARGHHTSELRMVMLDGRRSAGGSNPSIFSNRVGWSRNARRRVDSDACR